MDIKGLDSFWSLCVLEIIMITIIFKKELFLWTLGLFLNPQGSHSNRLCVLSGSMATKGCDFIRGELSMPRKIKIRVWKMSDQLNVFLDHVPWNGKVS